MDAVWCLCSKQSCLSLMFRSAYVVVWLALMLSWGCGQEPLATQGTIEPDDNQLIANSKFAEVVRIDWLDRKQCSGSLIANNMVLTAAHCLWDVELKNQPYAFPKELQISTSASGNDGQEQIEPLEVVAIHIHPAYRFSPCDPALTPAEKNACSRLPPSCLPTPANHDSRLACYEKLRQEEPAAYQILHHALVHQVYDAAVLELKQPAKLPVAKLPWHMQSPPLLPGEQIYLAGYGDQPDGTSGSKHVVRTSIAQVYATEFIAGTMANERQACSGDSGGPAYVTRLASNGEHELLQVGVHYAVFGANCTGGSIHINTSSLLPWLEQLQLAHHVELAQAPQALLSPEPVTGPVPIGASASMEATITTAQFGQWSHPIGWLVIAFVIWRYLLRNPHRAD